MRIWLVLMFGILFGANVSATQIYFAFKVSDMLAAADAQTAFDPNTQGVYSVWARPGASAVTTLGSYTYRAAESLAPVDQVSQPNAYYLVTVNDSNGFAGGSDWAHWYVQQSGTSAPPAGHTRVLFATDFPNTPGNSLYSNTFAANDTTAPISVISPGVRQAGGKLDPNSLYMVALDSTNNVAYGTTITWTFWVAALSFNANGSQLGTKPSSYSFTLDGVAAAPEPGTVGLGAAGLLLMIGGAHARRRRKGDKQQ